MTIPISRFFLAIFGLTCICLCASQQAFGQSESNLQGKRVLFLVAEREYGTEKSLPSFANSLLTAKGAICDFAFARSNDRESIECHQFDGLEKLDEADILVVSARRRYPRSEDFLRIRHWIESGKPTILIRTASHAFGERAKGLAIRLHRGMPLGIHLIGMSLGRSTRATIGIGTQNLENVCGCGLSPRSWFTPY